MFALLVAACGGGGGGTAQVAQPPSVIVPHGIGYGADAGRADPQDHPMAYAFFASEAVDLGNLARAKEAADWLVDNTTASGGWGLGWAWDAFSDGSVNPTGATYGIDTAVGVRALFDVYEATSSTGYRDAAVKALEGYKARYTATPAGGYFWYSDQSADAVQTANVSAMLAAQYARSWKLTGRAEHRNLALAVLSQLQAEKHSDATGVWWSYGSNRPAANDALHAGYVVLGIAEASRYLGQTIDLEREAAHLRGFVKNGGVLESHPVANPGALQQSARSAGVAMIGLALAESGRVEEGRAFLEKLAPYKGSNGQYCFQEQTGCSYPRTQSQVVSSVSRVNHLAQSAVGRWVQDKQHASFAARDSARAFKFDDSLWLSNGYVQSGVHLRDLWRSNDGTTWQQAVAATPYDAYSGMAVHGGWIWAAQWSVWRSRDGVTWEQVLDDAPFADRNNNAEARLLSFNGQLWCLCASGFWSSSDGVTWEKAPAAPFAGRKSYAATVWRDRLWVVGGADMTPATPADKGYPDRDDKSEVWSSADGRVWQLETATAEWSARMWPGIVVHKDQLYIFGGYDNTVSQNLGDTWRSTDGKTWTQVLAGPSFSARHFPTLFSVGDDIVLAAGNAWPVVNDIWRLTTPN